MLGDSGFRIPERSCLIAVIPSIFQFFSYLNILFTLLHTLLLGNNDNICLLALFFDSPNFTRQLGVPLLKLFESLLIFFILLS